MTIWLLLIWLIIISLMQSISAQFILLETLQNDITSNDGIVSDRISFYWWEVSIVKIFNFLNVDEILNRIKINIWNKSFEMIGKLRNREKI